jgi:uncharacterized tellurite resistance protein B-like protein
MFERLAALFSKLAGGDSHEFDETDHRLAAAALLIHLADSDGATGVAEAERIRTIIAERFGLEPSEASRLVAAAIRSDREAVDLYGFTSVLKRALSEAERINFIEMMWRIAYADGKADELEDNIVWRVAELLGVSARDRVMLRQRIGGEDAG